MEAFLLILCIILIITIIFLLIKIALLRKAADELRYGFAEKLTADTNVEIDLSSNDKKMRLLAADMNRQLRLLRHLQLRYTRGDLELKNAITNISHDLRTPLTAICGYMDLLKTETHSEQTKEYLRIIENRIQALKTLTEELFRYSVILSDQSYTIMQEVSLNRSLEESIAAFYGAFKKAGIEPEIQIPEQAVICNLNPQALSRILSNIIGNGIKYSDEDFLIQLTKDGTFYFRNKASQLDEVSVGHLFDRFYTVETARNSTGLGLSIAKTLTEEMKGEIHANYQNGSLEITLSFPIISQHNYNQYPSDPKHLPTDSRQ